MRMYDIIVKKRDGNKLSREEIELFIRGVTDGSVPDYQTSALLMAIYLRGMTHEETVDLTLAMARSGDTVDLSEIDGVKVDKHSTGGVGDKTTLIVAPIVASLGVKVAKMSGRGLGHTGGTVDKLESVPSFRTVIDRAEFIRIVNEVGCALIGQSGNLAPADKKLYALRDVTATVNSIPLIASSIMSKKLAAGCGAIVLDVKTGSGAFMKTVEDSAKLARAMVDIGNSAGKKTVALITDMDRPLGFAIGNSIEIIEAAEIVKGSGPADLREISVALAANMLFLAGKGSLEDCEALANKALDDGSAFAKFKEILTAQGGDARCLDDRRLFAQASVIHEVKSEMSGYIQAMDTEKCGVASVILGAGRETKESPVDYAAGILLKKKIGDSVEAGDTLAEFYTNNAASVADAERVFKSALKFGGEKPKDVPLIHARVE